MRSSEPGSQTPVIAPCVEPQVELAPLPDASTTPDGEEAPPPTVAPPFTCLPVAETRGIIIALLVMFVSICVAASIGPLFKWVTTRLRIRPGLVAVWRNQPIILMMIPPMLIEWMRSTADERTVWMSPVRDDDGQTRHVFLYLFGIGFLWAGSLYLYVLSLEYTTAVRATLFSNTQPVLLLLYYRYVKKVKHSTGEILGVFVAFAGIAMAMLERRQRSTSDALIGDLMNLVVACIMSSNIVLAGRVRKTVPIFMYTVVTVSVQTVFLMIITLAAEGSEISMARKGLFGWLDTKYTKSFMLIGFLGGYFGILGRNFAVARIHPVVISVFSLFGPIFTVWLVYIVGLEEIPKTWTIVGGCTVLFGIFLVVFFEHLRSRHEKQLKERAAVEEQRRLDAELALPSFASDMEEFSTHDFSCPGPVPVDSPAI